MNSLTVPGDLSSLGAIRDFVRLAAAEAGLDKRLIYRLILAVDEIATNIIVHGYEENGSAGDVEVAAEISDDSLVIILEDSAPPYNPPTEAVREDLDRPLEERDIGGLGVFLAIQNVDQFVYERIGDHNRHTFMMKR